MVDVETVFHIHRNRWKLVYCGSNESEEKSEYKMVDEWGKKRKKERKKV